MSKSSGDSPVKIAFLGLLWLALGLMPILFELDNVRLAFGRTGTPGEVAVTSCTDLGDDRYDCRGVFVPDDPNGKTVEDVELPPDSDAGETFSARFNGERAFPTGLQGRLGALSLPLLGLAILVPLPWGVAYMAFHHVPSRFAGWGMTIVCGLSVLGCFVGLVAAS